MNIFNKLAVVVSESSLNKVSDSIMFPIFGLKILSRQLTRFLEHFRAFISFRALISFRKSKSCFILPFHFSI